MRAVTGGTRSNHRFSVRLSVALGFYRERRMEGPVDGEGRMRFGLLDYFVCSFDTPLFELDRSVCILV